MRHDKISFSKLKLTNNKQLLTEHSKNQVNIFYARVFQRIIYLINLDDIDS